MKISEFFEKNFQLTEGSLISLEKDKKIIIEDVEFKNEYVVKKPASPILTR